MGQERDTEGVEWDRRGAQKGLKGTGVGHTSSLMGQEWDIEGGEWVLWDMEGRIE